MKPSKIITAAVWTGIVGGIVSLLALMMSGAGDHADAYKTYLIASAIVFGFSILAAAVAQRSES
jgi:FtsH-binding integral membrane protein